MQRNPILKSKVDELISLGLSTDQISPELSKRLLRLLRPASSDVDDHAMAVKHKLRETLLSGPVGGSERASNVALFEKECENIRKTNPQLLNAFLAMLLPLTNSQSNVTPALNSKLGGIETPPKVNSSVNARPSNELPVGYRAVNQPSDAELQALSTEIAHVWVSKDVEMKLIRDLLYTFQGVTSKHIRFDPRSESYVVDPSLHLPTSVRDTVLSLCELGWLFSKVSAYCTRAESIEVSKGLVVQAFGFSLQEELHDYYRLLAVLEQELTRVSTTNIDNQPANSSSTPSPGGSTMNSRGGSSGLTLLRLRTWLQEPIDRMCLLAKLVDAIGPLTGGALASRLYGHCRHGDASVVKVVTRIMDAVCAPLYAILTRWILYGDLRDPYQEFFISMRDEPASQLLNVWIDTYQLRSNMLPSYLSLNLANKILVIGKSINFIRLCKQRVPAKRNVQDTGGNSKDDSSISPRVSPKKKESRMSASDGTVGGSTLSSPAKVVPGLKKGMAAPSMAEALGSKAGLDIHGDMTENSLDENGEHDDVDASTMFDVSEDVELALQSLRFGNEERLQELVGKVSATVDSRLLRLMELDFHIADHLLACKKFMLLGQGDFVTCLMDNVAPELQKAANKLYRHNLTGMLEGALRSSNAQFEPSYVLNRVVVRLLEGTAGDTGWEIFTLDYAVDLPLNAVLHNDAIAKYRTAFLMLWRLKRVEWSLSAAWKQLMTLSHSAWRGYGRDGRAAWRAEFPQLLPVLQRCTLSRGRMVYVINNLCAFIMFEVLESAWNTLMDGMKKAKNLDDVIKTHDAYLKDILDRALLAPQHENLNNQIQRLLQSILRFCSVESSLITDATVAMSRRRRAREERNPPKGSTRGTTNSQRLSQDRGLDVSMMDTPGSFDGVAGYMVTRVDEAIADYDTQFSLLMSMLREQGERAGDIVRYLTFRLEFNDYYDVSKLKTGPTRVAPAAGSSLDSLSQFAVAPDEQRVAGASRPMK